MYITAQTPTGGTEAECLFQQAVDCHIGRNGRDSDLKSAQKLYAKALKKGSPKAALNLGYLYKTDVNLQPDREKRHRYMLAFFHKAAQLGCPEGLFCLYEALERGQGIPRDHLKANKLLKKAALGGSVMAMARMGALHIIAGNAKEGIFWLNKALAEGNGDAAYELAVFEKNTNRDIAGMIGFLRKGARMSSIKCIRTLAFIYELGQFGQEPAPKYAEELFALQATIDPRYPPEEILNFDARFPPRKIKPLPAMNAAALICN